MAGPGAEGSHAELVAPTEKKTRLSMLLSEAITPAPLLPLMQPHSLCSLRLICLSYSHSPCRLYPHPTPFLPGTYNLSCTAIPLNVNNHSLKNPNVNEGTQSCYTKLPPTHVPLVPHIVTAPPPPSNRAAPTQPIALNLQLPHRPPC